MCIHKYVRVCARACVLVCKHTIAKETSGPCLKHRVCSNVIRSEVARCFPQQLGDDRQELPCCRDSRFFVKQWMWGLGFSAGLPVSSVSNGNRGHQTSSTHRAFYGVSHEVWPKQSRCSTARWFPSWIFQPWLGRAIPLKSWICRCRNRGSVGHVFPKVAAVFLIFWSSNSFELSDFMVCPVVVGYGWIWWQGPKAFPAWGTVQRESSSSCQETFYRLNKNSAVSPSVMPWSSNPPRAKVKRSQSWTAVLYKQEVLWTSMKYSAALRCSFWSGSQDDSVESTKVMLREMLESAAETWRWFRHLEVSEIMGVHPIHLF